MKRCLFFLLVAACGGSVSSTGDAGPSSALDDLPLPTGPIAHGTVMTQTVAQPTSDGQLVLRPAVTAKFSPAPILAGMELGPFCKAVREIGACTVVKCSRSVPPMPDIGTLRATSGADTVTLRPDGNGGLYAPFERNEYFTAGSELAVDSSGGGDVPAFKATIAVPPVFPKFLDRRPIVRSSDYTLTWAPVDADVMVILTHDDWVVCRFPGKDGTGTIDRSTYASWSTFLGAAIVTYASKTTTMMAGSVAIDVIGTNGFDEAELTIE
jgi:hypothetical protein